MKKELFRTFSNRNCEALVPSALLQPVRQQTSAKKIRDRSLVSLQHDSRASKRQALSGRLHPSRRSTPSSGLPPKELEFRKLSPARVPTHFSLVSQPSRAVVALKITLPRAEAASSLPHSAKRPPEASRVEFSPELPKRKSVRQLTLKLTKKQRRRSKGRLLTGSKLISRTPVGSRLVRHIRVSCS